MTTAVFGIALALVSAVALGQEDCPLEGKWRSNEAMTVADMNKRGNVTDKQRKLLSNGFFGRFVKEFTRAKGRAYFAEDGADSAEWEPYLIRETADNTLVLGYPSMGKEVLQRIEFEGACFKTPIKGLGFYEYFCRDVRFNKKTLMNINDTS